MELKRLPQMLHSASCRPMPCRSPTQNNHERQHDQQRGVGKDEGQLHHRQHSKLHRVDDEAGVAAVDDVEQLPLQAPVVPQLHAEQQHKQQHEQQLADEDEECDGAQQKRCAL